MKTIQQAARELNAFQFSELYHAIKEAEKSRAKNKHSRYTHEGVTGTFYFKWSECGILHLDKVEGK